MSYSKNKLKKERKALRTNEERAVSNKIRSGVFPRYFFTKQELGSNQLQRKKNPITGRNDLTWQIESTYKALTEKANDSKS